MLVEILIADGIFKHVFCDGIISNLTFYLKAGKIPFLVWCVHPLTFGCKDIVIKVFGPLCNLLTMNEERFKILFMVIIGGAVSFLGSLMFVEGSLHISQLAKWQIALLTILFPLVASLYNVAAGVKIVSE